MKHTSIIGAVQSYLDEDPVSFHVPGHKNGNAFKNEKDVLVQMDVTEIPGTDNLHQPEEAILSIKKKAADVYGAKESYLLVNGTTCGNQAMILAVTKPGDHILIARNAHKSVHTACILGNLNPEYIYPEVHKTLGIPLGISAEAVETYLKKHNYVKALVITSPTYEGVHTDIEAISKVTEKYGVYLLVDEAHGAHVALDSRFGKSAIECGADIAVQSTHKSMRALTQASMLHVCGDDVQLHKVESWLAMLQSSSPSYVLLSSLEMTLEDFGNAGKIKANKLIKHLSQLKDQLSTELGLTVLSNEHVSAYGYSHDVSKLVIFMKDAELISDKLRNDYAIQVEYATADFLVCVTSIWNEKSDFDRMFTALKELNIEKHNIIVGLTDYPCVEVKMSPNQAFYSDMKVVNLENATGSICGEYIIPYPPGIPLLSPGEIITEELINLIGKWKSEGHSVIGSKDESLKTIMVID